MRMHHRIREMFHGRKNVFTVLFMLLGTYLIIIPFSKIVLGNFSDLQTIVIGLVVFFFGYYLSDALHKKKK